jgi:hypothetical protein
VILLIDNGLKFFVSQVESINWEFIKKMCNNKMQRLIKAHKLSSTLSTTSSGYVRIHDWVFGSPMGFLYKFITSVNVFCSSWVLGVN